MIAEAISTILLVAVLLSLADLSICKMNKDRHGGDNSALRWVYHLRRYSIPIPDFYLSTYYAKASNMKSKVQFCCLDDPVLKQIAEDFDDMFHKKMQQLLQTGKCNDCYIPYYDDTLRRYAVSLRGSYTPWPSFPWISRDPLRKWSEKTWPSTWICVITAPRCPESIKSVNKYIF
ncbi:hypothetical protein [Methanomethylophilus alvi]|uniref:hypothetical protein n=1 Tax=Methanomethylophilus alvi TaxID=1291540 RepID=UPI0037DC2CC9